MILSPRRAAKRWPGPETAAVLLDARRNEVYGGLYAANSTPLIADAVVPLGRAIPGTTSSSFVFSAQNFFRKNYGMPIFDPEMSGNDGFNATVRYISEHIPSPAVFLTSLRISF